VRNAEVKYLPGCTAREALSSTHVGARGAIKEVFACRSRLDELGALAERAVREQLAVARRNPAVRRVVDAENVVGL